MGKPSARKINVELKRLRALVDSSADPCEQRIAYAMETAILWATTSTVGWIPMAADAKQIAGMLRKEIMQNVQANTGVQA